MTRERFRRHDNGADNENASRCRGVDEPHSAKLFDAMDGDRCQGNGYLASGTSSEYRHPQKTGSVRCGKKN